MSFTERHFFLEENSKPVYCVEYFPADTVRQEFSIILAKPIWGERIRTHATFSNLARFLCNEGYCVFTCDYYGDGNSGGETIDLTFTEMVLSVKTLHQYICKKSFPEKIVLIGLRLGANVSMAVEPQIPNTLKMLLFEPIEKPIDYFSNALRANLANQMTVYKKIIKTREDLINDLRENRSVNIDGFVIGGEFWKSFESISPFSVDSEYAQTLTVYAMVPKGKKNTKIDFSWITKNYPTTEIAQIEQEFIWTGWKKNVPRPMVFFNEIFNQLKHI